MKTNMETTTAGELDAMPHRPGNDYFLPAPTYLPGSLSKLSLHPSEQK
jgi:hypothetical protein